MENKLTAGELIKVLNVCEKIYQGNLQAYYPHNEHKIRLKEFTLRINQIKKMIENYEEVQAFAMEIIGGKRITREWIETKTNQMEQMFMQPQRRKDREFFIRKLYEDMNIEVSDE